MASKTSRWIQSDPRDFFWTFTLLTIMFGAFHLEGIWDSFSRATGVKSPRLKNACHNMQEFLSQLEYQTYDFRFQAKKRLRPPRVTDDLVLIAIDDGAIDRFGRWPWPRSHWVKVVDALQKLGAGAIFFDVEFPEASQPVLAENTGGETFQEIFDKQCQDLMRLVDPKGSFADYFKVVLQGDGSGGLPRGQRHERIPSSRWKVPDAGVGVRRGFSFLQDYLTSTVFVIQDALRESLMVADAELARAFEHANQAGCGTFGIGVFYGLPTTIEDHRKQINDLVMDRALTQPDGEAISEDVQQYFSTAEIDELKNKVALARFVQKNYSLTLDQVAERMGLPKEFVQTVHFTVRELVLRQATRLVFEADPDASKKPSAEITRKVAERLLLSDPAMLDGLIERVLEQERGAQIFLQKNRWNIRGGENLNLPGHPQLTPPVPILAAAYKGMGSATANYDSDGSIRRLPLFWKFRGKLFPHASLELAADRMKIDPMKDIEIIPGPYMVIRKTMGDKVHVVKVPLDERGRAIVMWSGPFEDDHVPHLNLGAVIDYANMLEIRDDILDRNAEGVRQAKFDLRKILHQLPDHGPAEQVSLRELLGDSAGNRADERMKISEWIVDFEQRIETMKQEYIQATRTPVRMIEKQMAKFLEQLAPGEKDLCGRFNEDFKAFGKAVKEKGYGDEAGDFDRKVSYSAEAIAWKLEQLTHGEKPKVPADDPKHKKILDFLKKRRPLHDLYARLVVHPEEQRLRLQEYLKDRTCIIGMTATASTDLAPMPLQDRYPKVGCHTTLYNNLVTGQFIARPSQAWSQVLSLPHPALYDLLLWILMAVVALAFLPKMSITAGAVAIVAFTGIYGLVATFFLTVANTWIDFIGPSIVCLGSYTVITVRRYVTEEHLKRMYRKSFETLVDPKIVNAVLENQDILRKMGGANYEVTAFFSDIEGFTTISELLSPEELAQMLVDYLTPMTHIITKRLDEGGFEGTRDKYIGDAIVAFWGAPLPVRDHATLACLASIKQQEELKVRKKQWETEGKSWYKMLRQKGKDINFRIGLNTGMVKVGVFGAENASNYTMIGDAVNLASRLEGANKEYGTNVMIAEATYLKAREAIEVRELDRIRVKGKLEPVTIFEVLAPKGKLDPKKAQVVELFHRGLALYRERKWDEAKLLFEQAMAIDPHDGPSNIYHLRVQDLDTMKTLGPDWDGVFVMTHK